jgi:hypothetical protein
VNYFACGRAKHVPVPSPSARVWSDRRCGVGEPVRNTATSYNVTHSAFSRLVAIGWSSTCLMKIIADLDELLLRCRPGPSKAYAEEAVATYRAGAYRSCIVTTWIATVFDIIDKMREAALFGNSEIKAKLADFDRWQLEIANGNKAVLSQALAFEREILSYAHKKLEFIDGQQLVDLERLQDDRNRCAHPTFQRDAIPYQPSGEIARAHLCHASSTCFSSRPYKGGQRSPNFVEYCPQSIFLAMRCWRRKNWKKAYL